MGNVGACCQRQLCNHPQHELEICNELADSIEVGRKAERLKGGQAAALSIIGRGLQGGEERERLFLTILDKLEANDECDSNSEADELDFSSTSSYDRGSRQRPSKDQQEVMLDDEEKPLEDWELAAAWDKLIRRQMPKRSVAARILHHVTVMYSKMPGVVRIPRPSPGERFVIVGDLHGHFGDFTHLYQEHGEPKKGTTQYLFNGDFVDRGQWGPEVLLSIYCLKLRFPTAVHLNRGNHEDFAQNKDPNNGFCDDHCHRAWQNYSEHMYRLCRASFEALPLASVVGDEVFVVHGGLPVDRGVTLKDIDSIDRRQMIPIRRCTLLGYPIDQVVKAKRDLVTDSGQRVSRGTYGQMVSKVRRRTQVKVAFRGYDGSDTTVEVGGCPELEQDLDISFASDKDRLDNRRDRLFIAMMWSDPTDEEEGDSAGPNLRRGAGAFFDKKMAEDFLKTNGLKCIIRSHQKRQLGFRPDHFYDDGRILAATVFSASNYPSGAGEPASGNQASVVVLCPADAKAPLLDAMKGWPGWLEAYAKSGAGQDQTNRGAELRKDAQALEEKLPAASAKALEQLWRLIFCSRAKLLKYFHHHDPNETGCVKTEVWASAMRACVIPDDDFPWEDIASDVATFNGNSCYYQAFLGRYTNIISDNLARRWCKGALAQLAAKFGSLDYDAANEQEPTNVVPAPPPATAKERAGEARRAWDRLDRDQNGTLTYTELKPMIHSHLQGNDLDFEEDLVYAMLAWLDTDKSGFVDRDEFLRAVLNSENDTSRVMDEAVQVIEQCWAALQGVLRTLCAARCRVAAVFRSLDSNGNGTLDRDEFGKGLEKLLDGAEEMETFSKWEPLLWRLFDEDGGGYLDFSEFMNSVLVFDAKLAAQAGTSK